MTMCIEDRVFALMTDVATEMDNSIEGQSNYIRGLSDGTGAANGQTSRDVEVMKLQQLVVKRNNVVSALFAVIEKFDESAKKATNAIEK